ncbi:hypothetical protein GGR56DRAFT_683556 [Xylariaceae sp. FL0804]|nr:hypothetical protein GGR56DRAFT_683556 [Xylariaceae sp. FL0804]
MCRNIYIRKWCLGHGPADGWHLYATHPCGNSNSGSTTTTTNTTTTTTTAITAAAGSSSGTGTGTGACRGGPPPHDLYRQPHPYHTFRCDECAAHGRWYETTYAGLRWAREARLRETAARERRLEEQQRHRLELRKRQQQQQQQQPQSSRPATPAAGSGSAAGSGCLASDSRLVTQNGMMLQRQLC